MSCTAFHVGDQDTLVKGLIRSAESLASHTTFRVGGPAEWYCEPTSLLELQQCLAWSFQSQTSVTFLGAGSNLLISDQGLRGLVINTRRLREIQILPGGRLWAAAGAPLKKLADLAARHGWSGMEWAIGIPGTVGGAVVMNAGAHQQSIADVLLEVTLLDDQAQPQQLTMAELNYGYRSSLLQQRTWIVTGASFQLHPGHDPAHIKAQTERNWLERQQRQPYDLPSCGSVFRNPKPMAAGWLIEQTGLKGHQIGGAQVANRHANFILNCGQASATDIHTLIRFVQGAVFERWSLVLEPEVRILGDFGLEPLLTLPS
ncbi:MAG: UDP-N-acetylmuramate dehydrogenase [Synechococcaceae cyanobacterium SM2_3_1]|nr:UDP-N-acetylmuramate dehydrogenase [Synechococcaceae cyanobacterium SM2_3_1]